ncbi:MAG: DUF3078 domain-containing protein [Bacteroidota bacterium]|nr:DUF3078 domain-containing protein [Bacteroidota bacterium]
MKWIISKIIKRIFFICCISIISFSAIGQVTEDEFGKVEADTILGWKKGGLIQIGGSQVSLTNWIAGGQSSVAVNGIVSLYARKTMESYVWENFLDLGYGLIRQGEQNPWRKTDDRLDFTSKFGRTITDNWNFTGLLNFKTQFTEGVAENGEKISSFMAPAYLIAAIGGEYKPNQNFSFFLAPLASKNTFVLDPQLSETGSFGVDPGSVYRSEFGGYFRMAYKVGIMENISFQTKVELFSNYLNNPENIDVNWETLLSLKVNKYISTTLATHLIYDHDIAIPVDRTGDGIFDSSGPRTQFKQVLTVGIAVTF